MSITKLDRKTGDRRVRRVYSAAWLAVRAARAERRAALRRR